MLTISHRGYCPHAIENTLEAFDRAMRIGVDGIETDVRMTADGQLVLLHDRQLGDGRPVSEIEYRALSDSLEFSVPTLAGALEWSDRPLWILELKDAQATAAFIRALKPFLSSHRILVTSFWHNAMTQIEQQSEIECAVNVTHRPADFRTSQLSKWRTIVWHYGFVDQELIQESAASGHRNFVYHVKGPAEHRKCCKLGVDGVITDEPNLVAAAVRG